jgi:Fe2+ transport system protein FeoA
MISPTNAPPIPLDFLPSEAEGVIAEIAGCPSSVHRLEEMGVRCGCHIRMLTRGEPCLLNVDGKRMCLRLGEVAEILVTQVSS